MVAVIAWLHLDQDNIGIGTAGPTCGVITVSVITALLGCA
jgi:hypothetical protein